MKRALIILVVLGALGAMVYAGVTRSSSRGSGPEVYTEAVERRDITQVVKATGRIDPREKVNISAHIVAKIERLYVEEGDDIAAGQPVVELEREAYQAIWDRAVAQLRIADNQLRQAEIDLRDAQRREKRYASLLAQGVASEEKSEEALLARETAELKITQAQQQQIQARADLEKARDDLEKVTLYAPLSGRVIALNAEEGEVVVSGTMNNPASVIATIADLSEILVEVDVDETEIVFVREGQGADASVDAVEDHMYHGTVDEIGSSGYTRAGKGDVIFYSVKILLEDADDRLKPGMTARAEIAVETHEQTAIVPIQSVVYRRLDGATEDDDEEQVVFVVENGQSHMQAVVTGLADTTHIEIIEGVAVGTDVVTGPYRSLRDLEDGDSVRIKESADDGEDGDKDGDE